MRTSLKIVLIIGIWFLFIAQLFPMDITIDKDPTHLDLGPHVKIVSDIVFYPAIYLTGLLKHPLHGALNWILMFIWGFILVKVVKRTLN